MGDFHRNLETVELHAPGYIATTDPETTHGTGAVSGNFGVKAGQLWIEESSEDTPTALKYRNAANDGWVTLLDDPIPSLTAGDLLFADASANLATLGIGSEHDVLVASATPLPAWKSGLTNDNIAAAAEIAVSKLADGTARQLLQTDAAGTGVEWASNIDIPGTLDVTGAVTLDSTLAVAGGLSSVEQSGGGSGPGGVFKSTNTGQVGIRHGSFSNDEYRWSTVDALTSPFATLTTSGALTTTGAATLDTGANGSSFGGALQIGGALNHDGSTVGLFGTTPASQPTTGATAEAAFVENAGGTAVNVDSTFGGYTLQQLAQALQDIGAIA